MTALATDIRLTLVASIGFAVLVFGMVNDAFVATDSLTNILTSLAFIGLIAVGETVLIIAGEFDLSVGAVAGLAAVASAKLMVSEGVPVSVGLLAALAVGAGAGLFNGLAVTRLGVPSFVTTIGTLYIASGLGQTITHGEAVYPLPTSLDSLGIGEPLGLSWPFLILLALAGLTEAFLRTTVPGRAVFAVGGDREVARNAGVDVARVKLLCFVFVGLLVGLAGFLQMAQQSTAQATLGTGWELTAIAAVIIGGTSIFGGSGSVAGTLLGLLLLGVVTHGLVSASVSPNWQTLAVGTIMIAAIASDVLRRRLVRVRSRS